MNYEIHYDELFKGKIHHMVIVVSDHQVQGEVQAARNNPNASNLDVKMYLPEE